MILKFLAVFIAGELVAVYLFSAIWRWLGPEEEPPKSTEERQRRWKVRAIEVFKGVLERFVVCVGLLMQYQGVLTLYAALKLGNRLRHEESSDDMTDDQSNRITNYFLIGNLLSILLCLLYIAAATAWYESD